MAGLSLALQIVNDSAEFEISDLEEHIKKWELQDAGREYSVVAIMGCQSGGKSTLLNRLFRTSFAEMDIARGRQQTTLGIWAAKADSAPIIIMDVEGTDSRERGEQHVSFERKTSLFSLALADVLLVNMWYTDIGRYEASNYSLLQTVFELDLRLFQRESARRSTLMFVIRDHHGVELERLQSLLLADVEKIFNSVQKPNGLDELVACDLFDFEFVGLPSFVLQQNEFEKQVSELRKRFIDKSHPNCVVGGSHVAPSVPADGFSAFARDVWDIIVEERDLDLPTQREMLASYRCDETKDECLKTFVDTITEYSESIDLGKPVEKLGENLSSVLEKVLSSYDTVADGYLKEVADEKRAKLVSGCNAEAESIIKKQIVRLVEIALNRLETLLSEKTPSLLKTFIPTSVECVEVEEKWFLEQCEESTALKKFGGDLEGCEECDVQNGPGGVNAKKQLYLELAQDKIDRLRPELMNDAAKDIYLSLQSSLKEPCETLFDAAALNTWSRVRACFNRAIDKHSIEITDMVTSFAGNDEEIEEWKRLLKVEGKRILWDISSDVVRNLVFVMTAKFDNLFKFEENGVPRTWRRKTNVEGLYKNAKREAKFVLKMFSVFRIEPEDDLPESLSASLESSSSSGDLKNLDDSSITMDDLESIDPSKILIPLSVRKEIEAKFSMSADESYRLALQLKEAAYGIERVPSWMYVVLFALGFNEMKAVVTKPILFVPAALLLLGLFALQRMGLLDMVLEISRSFLVSTAKQALETLQERQPRTLESASTRQTPTTSAVSSTAITTKHAAANAFAKVAQKKMSSTVNKFKDETVKQEGSGAKRKDVDDIAIDE